MIEAKSSFSDWLNNQILLEAKEGEISVQGGEEPLILEKLLSVVAPYGKLRWLVLESPTRPETSVVGSRLEQPERALMKIDKLKVMVDFQLFEYKGKRVWYLIASRR